MKIRGWGSKMWTRRPVVRFGNPDWFTYPMRAADAVSQPRVMAGRTGDLHSALTVAGTHAADYFLDIANGSDLGTQGTGKSFEFHTYAVAPSKYLVSNVGSAYTSDFNLKWLDSSGNLQMLRFLHRRAAIPGRSDDKLSDRLLEPAGPCHRQ